MNSVHPMLTNILSLADSLTWQKSIDLADEALSNWKSAKGFRYIYFVGHGSSLFNGLVGEYILEHIAGIPSKAIPAFAFSKYTESSLLGPRTLVVGISTTGATESAYKALELARETGSSTLAITAHAGTPITQFADTVILSGGEDDRISVKTKSYIQALISIYMLALQLAGDREKRTYWLNQIQLAAQGANLFFGSRPR